LCDECNWPLCTLFNGNLVLTKLHKWCRHKDVCDDTSEKFVSCARTQVVCGYVTNYVCDFETRPLSTVLVVTGRVSKSRRSTVCVRTQATKLPLVASQTSLWLRYLCTISRRMARACVAASACCGGGYRGPAFMDYKINNFLDIMGEIMPIDGHLEWAAVIDRHKVLFGIKNRDMQSLHHKFNNLARMTPPTGDANIPPLDVQHAIKIKMDSGRVTFHDLGTEVCDGGDGGGGLDGDLELDEDCVEAGDEAVAAGANLVNEFGINEEQLCNDLCHTPVDGINIHHT